PKNTRANNEVGQTAGRLMAACVQRLVTTPLAARKSVGPDLPSISISRDGVGTRDGDSSQLYRTSAMKRILFAAPILFLFLAQTVLGQGVLVVINPPHPIPLPRPIP